MFVHSVEVKSHGVTLHNRVVEQPFALRGDKMGGSGGSSSALAEDGHTVGVSSEDFDVPLDPLQSILLIHKPVVSVEVIVHQKPKSAQAVVDDNHNGFSLTSNGSPVVQHSARSTLQEFATREKYHHGISTLVLGGIFRGIDIQIQAIFANEFRAGEGREGTVLNAPRTEACGISDSAPGNHGARRSPSEMAGRGSGERHRQKVATRLITDTLEGSCFDGDLVSVAGLTPSHSKDGDKK